MTSDVRAALEAGDDGFHEIQLNGKQLVFLGMATTLVSVVIFLCGVLVGRGVKPLDTVAQAAGPQAFDTPVSSPVAPGAIATPAPAPPATPAPSGARDSGRRSRGCRTRRRHRADAARRRTRPVGARAGERPRRRPGQAGCRRTAAVEPKTPKVEPREAAKPKPAPVQASAAPPAPVAAAPKPTPAPAAVATAAPASAGGAIAVQVGAFATRKEADALAKKLSGRGYAVYVMNPTGTARTSIASASATTAPPTKRSASAPG